MKSREGYATVVYADISGFTAISEKLDPEDVTSVMNRCFEILEGIVVAHGGQVNQYLGDCVLAVFGLDEATDASRRAIRAALEIRSAIYQFNEDGQLPSPLDIHIGIGTGPVLAGEIGGEVRREFHVSGPTVHLASRLEDVSDKGQIFVSPITRKETDDEYEYRPVDPVILRESEPPVPVFELLGLKEKLRHVKRGSERRQASVLFADIDGFKTLAESLGPERTTELLNDCFCKLERIVRERGGVIDKYIGECVMALFGVPNAIENAPQEAVNAAIEIRNEVQRISQDLPFPIQIHMGVNTGLVIAGEIGGRIKRDFTVMGDTVNLASRLKDAAPMGRIYAGPSTYRYTRGAFEFQMLEPLRVKGKAEPIPTYDVRSERGRLYRARSAPDRRQRRSPLVGRRHELAHLTSAMDALAEGRGGIVSVCGEAGLGKSRLVTEALDGRRESALVLEGHCTPIGQNLRFHPFADLLRRWAAIEEDDSDDRAQARLTRAIEAACPAKSRELSPFLSTLMGLRQTEAHARRLSAIDGESLERLVFRSVRLIFQGLADRKPLIVTLEDLHWADESSIRLLETLVSLTRGGPFLFLLLYRPDFRPRVVTLLERAFEDSAPFHREIALQPLPDHDTSQIIDNLLRIEDLPFSTRRIITRNAEGNPFYVEEVVQSLVEQGAVELRGDEYHVTERIESVTIPSTVQNVIMARVDRLDEPTRHVLQVASVIGRSFPYGVMRELLRRMGKLDHQFDRELEVLRRRQLLDVRGSPATAPSGPDLGRDDVEYTFTHAIAQQTIYESLLLRTRRDFHAMVADTTETLFASRLSEYFGMLAYHYGRAENLEKAETYLFQAGAEAARTAASSEALTFFQEASRVYLLLHPDGGDAHRRMEIEKNIAIAHWNKGNLTESIEHFDRTLQYLGVRVPRSSLAVHARFALDLLAVLYRLYLRSGWHKTRDFERERDIVRVTYCKARAETTSDPRRMFMDSIAGIRQLNRTDATRIDGACGMYATMGAQVSYAGLPFSLGRRFLHLASRFRREENLEDELTYRAMRFVNAYLAGDWDPRYFLDERLIDDAIRRGLFWDVQTYLGLECDIHLRRGLFPLARQVLDRLDVLAEDYGYDFARSNHLGMSAMLLLEERRLDDAEPIARRYHQTRHEDALRVLGLGILAKVHALQGKLDEAVEELGHAETIRERSGVIPFWHVNALLTAHLTCDVALLDDANGGRETRSLRRRARQHAAEAVTLCRKVRTQRTEIFRQLGNLHWAVGRVRRAVRFWEDGIREGMRLRADPELGRIHADVAVRLASSRRSVAGKDAAQHREEARQRFSAANLEADLRRPPFSPAVP